MLGWTKPWDVISIYEDVGRPKLMPNTDGVVYARGTPANEGGSEPKTPYAQSVSVEYLDRHRDAMPLLPLLPLLLMLPLLLLLPLLPRSQHAGVVLVQRETPEVGAEDAHAVAGGKSRSQPATHTPANDALLVDVASATAELAAVASFWQSSKCRPQSAAITPYYTACRSKAGVVSSIL